MQRHEPGAGRSEGSCSVSPSSSLSAAVCPHAERLEQSGMVQEGVAVTVGGAPAAGEALASMRAIWPNPPSRPILAAQEACWQGVRLGRGLAKWATVIWPNSPSGQTPGARPTPCQLQRTGSEPGPVFPVGERMKNRSYEAGVNPIHSLIGPMPHFSGVEP